MCKYCKNLKRIKDLDEKSLLKTIEMWKRREAKARNLLLDSTIALSLVSLVFPVPSIDELLDKVDKYLNSDWIGK